MATAGQASTLERTEIPATASSEGSREPFAAVVRWIDRGGLFLLALIAFMIPLFAVPANWFQWFRVADAVIVAKNIVLVFLSAGVLLLAAAHLALRGFERFRGPVLLPVGAIFLYLAWSTLSVALNPASQHFFYIWLPRMMPGLAALTGPLFLSNTKAVRIVLISALFGAVFVALIGDISMLGYRGFYEVIYGGDPRGMIEDTTLNQNIRVQGGMTSAASISTIANSEYAGTYAAALAALAAVFLLDWLPRIRNRKRLWVARGVMFVVIGLLLLLLAFSGSRQPWIALFLAALLRLMLYFEIPKLPLSVGFIAVLLIGLFVSIVPALILSLLLIGGAFLFAILRRGLVAKLRATDRFNLLLTAGFPALMLLLFVAFSTSGPWNPTGLRVAQRFGSLLTRDDQSYRERATMYLLASEMAWQNPVFGQGPGRYGNRFTPTLADLAAKDETGITEVARERLGRSLGEWSHNDYLQIAAEAGLPGLIFFLSGMVFLAGGLSRVIGTRRDWLHLEAIAVLVCMTAFFSIMMTSFPLQMPSRAAVFWMMTASALGIIACARREASEPKP